MSYTHFNLHHAAQALVKADSVSINSKPFRLDLLNLIRTWLDNLEISDPQIAKFLYRMIPGQCPFERDITVFGYTLLHIPPLCKLNPLYEQLVGLRFRSLCYLVDVCGESL